MQPAQLQALKTDIAANINTIPAGQPWSGSFAGQQIKDVPNTGDGNAAIAGWYNLLTAAYKVWRTSVSRSEVYNNVSDSGSSWDWTFYKNQSVTEQNAWTQMFMGDSANFALLNFRVGVGRIFTAGSSVNRDHCLNVGKRICNNIERLFVTPILSPPANSGNDGIAGNRGTSSNPDVMTFEGTISGTDVELARNS